MPSPVVRFRRARRGPVLALVLGLLAVIPAVPALPALAVVPLTTAAQAAAQAAPAGVLTTITKGLRGFDSLTVESTAQVNCLSSVGYSYDMVNTNDTTGAEYARAAAAGMKVVLFQGYYQPYWTSAANGTSQGRKAAAAAASVGYPRGAQIFLNLENTGNSSRAILLSWVRNWAAAVRAGSYVAGVYVGADPGLTAADLNAMPGVGIFWRSASTSGVPQVARGYAQQQPASGFERPLCGTRIDDDVANTDRNGRGLIGSSFPKAAAAPTAAGAFVPVVPARLLDTRTGTGARAGAVPAQGHLDLQVTGRGGVPATAGAVVANVTATAPTAAGYLSLYPTPATPIAGPSWSNLNFARRQTATSLATVKVNAAGRISVFNRAPGTTQVLIDVVGYYRPGTASAAGTFVPVAPSRVINAAAVAARSTSTFRLPVPAGGSYDAAVLAMAAVRPASSGYLTAFPAGTSRPGVAAIDVNTGATVATMVTVALGTGAAAGRVSVYDGAGRAGITGDVAGYYRSGRRSVSGSFQPVTQTRILNTATGLGAAGPVPALSAVSLLVRGRGGVPATARAVVLSTGVFDQRGASYLTVYPSDRSAPGGASALNFVAGTAVANQVIVPIGPDGRIELLNHSGATAQLLADVDGYFLG